MTITFKRKRMEYVCAKCGKFPPKEGPCSCGSTSWTPVFVEVEKETE